MPKVSSAHQKHIRQSPRKLRLVADIVRGQKVERVLTQLQFLPQQAAKTIAKVITQAKANALAQSGTQEASLVVDEIQIQTGPTLKRWNPVSRGRAHPIKKRTSHIKVTLSGTSQKET